ncbi:MAG: bifunctional glutamate N-acetyltransferase/amino-acid acetyltransferase ArgJ [Thermodesulfobacteriota bacterium]
MTEQPGCPGFRFSGIAAGIKKNGNQDLGLIVSETTAGVAGVFTRNIVQAACVQLNRARIQSGECRAVVVNSGNANCCTGDEGMQDAIRTAAIMAERLAVPEEHILVASTGVIGQRLPVAKIETAAPLLMDSLAPSGIHEFARAILTTDLKTKITSTRIPVAGRPVTITGVAKGSGMIRPDMATMLCFVCSDVGASPAELQSLLVRATEKSFNRISVDGDTSTNDMILLLANGISGARLEKPDQLERFQQALDAVLTDLAKQVVRDGEGATKLVEISVAGAADDAAARAIADTVAHSNLVKTAFFGEDANWGRIIAAVGRARVPVDPDRISICFDAVQLVKNGRWCGSEAEAEATRILKKPEFAVFIDLQAGAGKASVLTCDFSVDYVKINANYRS